MKHLIRHFFGAMFDFGILNEAGADSFKHMLAGAAGALIAIGFGITRIYARKYAAFRTAVSDEPYRRAALGDDLFIIGLAMLLVAFVTVLVSDSLYPDERDFRILGPLPVRKAVFFGAKFTAVVLFTSGFALVVNLSLLPLLVLTSVNRWANTSILSRVGAWALASAGASALAVLLVAAMIGLLMLTVSHGRLQTLTSTVKSTVLAGLMVCLPLVIHLPAFGGDLANGSWWLMLVPPAWFVGLEQILLGNVSRSFAYLAAIAVFGLAASAVVVGASYLLLFNRFEHLMLRPATMSVRVLRGAASPAFLSSSPAFRAVYRFTVTTLLRSQLHQTVLIGLAGCGIGIAMNLWLGATPSRAATGIPFALMFACGLGARASLALPLQHRANWIFRMLEDGGTRADQLRAVDRIVTTSVTVLPAVAALAALWSPLRSTSVTAVAVVVLVGLVFAHVVLLDWRRIPFTSSYLPGKRFIGYSVVFGFVAWTLFTLVGMLLIRLATTTAWQAVVIAVGLAVLTVRLRRRRLTRWQQTPLMFEDELPEQLLELQLRQ